MRPNRLIIPTLALLLPATADEKQPSQDYLWYQQPAIVTDCSVPWSAGQTASGNMPGKKVGDSWESQTLPVGNGRVGGTVFGGDRRERVNLNEVSLWTGGPNEPNNGAGYAYGPKSGKEQFGSYQPFGNLFIDFELPEGEKPQSYTRSLDLRNAIARTQFTCDGVEHDRQCFVSHPDDVMVYRAAVGEKGKLSAQIGMTPYHTVKYSIVGSDTIVMSGTLANGEKFEGRMRLEVKGGSAHIKGKGKELSVIYEGGGKNMRPAFDAEGIPYFDVQKADSFVIYISLATDYEMNYFEDWKGESPDRRNANILKKIKGKSFKNIRSAHIADHRKYYDRMSISLGKTPEAIASLPTDKRLEAYRKKGASPDPELEATIYQYGRYVLIAGSRPGNLPANLQGIWNDKVHAPWASDYHNNINLQMCYWGAEVGNLSECHMPFIDFMKAMEEPLSRMTRKHFGAKIKGWTTRISQNPWGAGGWSKWNPPVNAWYALHIWDHYLYTLDREYLEKVGYPLMKNICAYWESSLKELDDGGVGLVSGGKPVKVENHPELKAIKKGALVCPGGWSHEWGPVEDGCAHDQQLIWELFDNTAKAAAILGKDAEWAKELTEKRDRLVRDRIADGGYLQEWIVDRPNMVSGQRHTSHLIGVFPGTTISMAKTPELAKAAAKSLELRGLSGDNRRSWTWPWRTALWARLGETDKAYDMVRHYLLYNVLDNLFGNHPPMQMDGTYGMTGGMSEMLIQSHAGQIELLPALPDAWKNGSVKGIRARGDITIDMEWKNGKVTSYMLRTKNRNPSAVKVIVNGEEKMVTPTIDARDKNRTRKRSKR